jgi:rRNA-processing protein FCF1
MVKTATVVIDTNLFLHYKQPDQLDWSALQEEAIEVVVPSTVIRELEKAKTFGKTERIRNRAGRMTAWLSGLMDEGFNVELKPGMRLRFEINEPKVDFAENNLNREVQDDVLIAALLAIAQTSTSIPIVATADVGVKAKARVRKFPVFTPRDSDKLADEPDQRDKELKELRKENEQLKNRQPRLAVHFSGAELRLNVVRPLPNPMPPTVREIMREFPLLGESNGERPLTGMHSLLFSSAISKTARERYNEMLKKYYTEYEKYTQQVGRLRMLEARRLELPLSILNEGTAPATDIDVIIQFPERTRLFIDERLIAEPKPPEPPKMPTPYMFGEDLLSLRDFTAPTTIHPNLFQREQKSWSFSTKENVAHYKLDRLKQGFHRDLPVIFLQYQGADDMESSSIAVQVSAAESVAPAMQQLHLIVSAA